MKRREFLRNAAMAGGAAALSGSSASAEAQSTVPEQRTTDGRLIERMTASSRARSGMALGGIGAGYFELRKDGRFYDWNIANNFPKESGPKFVLPDDEREDRMAANLFFEVRYQIAGEAPRIKLLQLDEGLYEGAEMGIAYSFPWMTAIDEISYTARFPIATLTFHDAQMPFILKLEAWSSFIPHDVKNSALPLVFFDFEAVSTGEKPVSVTVLMTARNFTGYESTDRSYKTTALRSEAGLTVTMASAQMDPRASSLGEISLGSQSPDASFYAGWAHRHPYYEQVLRHASLSNLDDTNGRRSAGTPLPVWLPDTDGRNHLDPVTGKPKVHDDDLFSTVAGTLKLAGRGTIARHSFLYAWNFPNLYNETEYRVRGEKIEGHFYSNFFASAPEVIAYGFAQRDALKRKTIEFLDHFFASDGDVAPLEQVNSQLNTFFTNGRLVRDGSFGVLEGLSKSYSWGPIATIDVMLYGTAPIIALFPELQKSTMRCHARVQLSSGEIEHGLQKDFARGEDNTAGVQHRIDLPGQFAILVMRDFFWTGDVAYLRELFPAVRRAIEYVLRERSGEGGAMPVTRGIETSYDNFPMEGYASYLLSQWICALDGAAEGADVLGDHETANRYRKLSANTREQADRSLWNGSFYKLYATIDGSAGGSGQGNGCLTDQLVGQWAAQSSGLPPLFSPERVQSALRSVLTRNFKPGFGLQNCSFRADGSLSDVDRDIWNDQANTFWSGVELAFASLLIYEGLYNEGVSVARTVDIRYRSNGLYWNHQEFGGHYFRPMSAWSLINAMLGFSVHNGRLTFDPKIQKQDVQLFFVTPAATARYLRRAGTVRLECLTGELGFNEVQLGGSHLRKATRAGLLVSATVTKQNGLQVFRFVEKQSLASGQEMSFT